MMDLQRPSVLAQLPRPFEATTGSTQIGEVYSLIGSKKRKRHEVAAAVDGEGINIYNVLQAILLIRFPKLMNFLGTIPKPDNRLCRSTAIFVLLPAMLYPPQNFPGYRSEAPDILRRGAPRKANPVFFR